MKKDYKISRITPVLRWLLILFIIFMVVMGFWGEQIYKFLGF